MLSLIASPDWEKVAEGDVDTFEQSALPQHIEKGQRLKLQIDTLPGLAYFADIWGAEWVMEKFLADTDMEIIDTYSQGSSRIIVDMVADPPGWPIIIASVVLGIIAIFGIGWAIKNLTLFVETVGPGTSTLLIVAGVAVVGLLGFAIYKAAK